MSSQILLHRQASAPAPARRAAGTSAVTGHSGRRPPQQRLAPRRAGLGVAHLLAWASMAMVAVIYLADRGTSGWYGTKDVLKSSGILAGLVSADLMCLMFLLAARIPWLDRLVGHDGAIARHSRLGSWVVGGVLAHGVLLTASYAMGQQVGVLTEFVQLLDFRDYALAVVSGALLLGVGLTSALLAVRRHLPHQLWYGVHLATYAALVLAIPHQFSMDSMFDTAWARGWWLGMYGVTGACVIAFRVVLPLRASLRHRLVVTEVRPEGPDAYSITMTGRDLDRLHPQAGQFMNWRFWTPALFWESHPFSVSAAPAPDQLRITVRVAGNGTRRLGRVRPGTMVSFEGPYGIFTSASRTRQAVVLMGSGSGIAPVRSLLEETPVVPHRALVVLRASSPSELLHLDEVRALCRARGVELVTLVGHRGASWAPAASGELRLVQLAPWLADADLYVCGPAGWMQQVLDEARDYGVPPSQLHAERFAF